MTPIFRISTSIKSNAVRIAEKICQGLALPIWISYCIESIFMGRIRACTSISQRAALWTGTLGVYMRRALFKNILAKSGSEVFIAYGSVLTKPSIELGDAVYIGSYCILGNVRVGEGTQIADFVSIPSGAAQHGISRLDVMIKDQPGIYPTVKIGADCWIGSHSVILADIGNHCVVGAGSVVTRPVPDYHIVAGNPARQIGDRREIVEKAELLKKVQNDN